MWEYLGGTKRVLLLSATSAVPLLPHSHLSPVLFSLLQPLLSLPSQLLDLWGYWRWLSSVGHGWAQQRLGEVRVSSSPDGSCCCCVFVCVCVRTQGCRETPAREEAASSFLFNSSAQAQLLLRCLFPRSFLRSHWSPAQGTGHST